MVRAKSHVPTITKKFYPFVSVCTPTFNRRPFFPTAFECFKNQDYPKDRMEWIIVDDGTDRIKDLVAASGISQIKYYELPNKVSLGEKRNIMHSKAKGTIIVYMDDDDYYPPDRVSHAVERLMENREALCAGSSEIYIYFKGPSSGTFGSSKGLGKNGTGKMVQFGPYGPNHATAGTFAFKAELLKQTRYDDSAAVAEERAFLKDYTVPFVQLDPMKTILCFSHEHNTFDKRKLLQNPHPDFVKDSTKTVEDFIKLPKEAKIKKFFMEDVDKLLENYAPGEPKMKPDVLKQIAEIEANRDKMIREEMAKQGANAQIILNQPGKPPVPLTSEQIIDILTQQGHQIQQYEQRIRELESIISIMQGSNSQGFFPIPMKESSNSGPPVLLPQLGKPEFPLKESSIPQLGNKVPLQNAVPISKLEPAFKLDPEFM
jgi:glycosyltransferase involved in cell wall biosynthesis